MQILAGKRMYYGICASRITSYMYCTLENTMFFITKRKQESTWPETSNNRLKPTIITAIGKRNGLTMLAIDYLISQYWGYGNFKTMNCSNINKTMQ